MIITVGILAYLIVVLLLYLRKKRQTGHRLAKKVAFFHPFCNDGGGGEKVLWTMVQSLLEQCPPESSYEEYCTQPIINIYSLQPNAHEIYTRVQQRFNINFYPYAHRINIIHIPGRKLLTPQPYLTMLCHILLPMFYCFRCLWRYQPDIFYDTTGFAFNFILVKFLCPRTECRAYVHYPFISDDMVEKIRSRRADFNNDSKISQSWLKTNLKLIYYRAILLAYKGLRFFVARFEANSSWTYNHMAKIWGEKKIRKLYPPCSISSLLQYNKNYDEEVVKIVSLAQFRPEKNHILQIKMIEELVKKRNIKAIHLFICGTTRGKGDEDLLSTLKAEVKLKDLSHHITFCHNFCFPDLMKKLEEAHCGIHTMEAQHFGISIVEMLAAGCLVLAHNSAGPKFDIIEDEAYLATSEEEYCNKLQKMVKMTRQEKELQSQKYRRKMEAFGQKQFKQNFREIFHG